MAITRDEFFTKKQEGALWDVGVSINRTTSLPLDKNAVFATEGDLDTYINGVLAYPGQTVAVVSAEGTQLYVLGYVGGVLSKQEIGKPTASDGESITLNDDGILSITGFDEAEEGYIPQVSANGEIEWVVNPQSSLTTDLTSIKSDIDSLKSKDTELGLQISNLGTVLNYKGSTTSEGFITSSDGVYAASKYKAGDVILISDTGEEYVCVTDSSGNNSWEKLGDDKGLTALQNRTTNIESALGDKNGDLAEADGTIYERIRNLNNQISTKANLTDFNSLKSTVSSHDVTISDNTESIRLHAQDIADLKTQDSQLKQSIESNSSAITALQGKVSTNEEAIKTNADDIDALEGRADTLESTINNATTGLAAVKTIADNAATAASKAQTTANAAMPKAGGTFTGKAYGVTPDATDTDKTALTTREYVDTKISSVNTSVSSTYATKTELSNAQSSLTSSIDSVKDTANVAKSTAEANTTSINDLSSKVGTVPTGYTSVVAYVNAVKTTADAAATQTALSALEGTVASNTSAISTINSNIGTSADSSSTSTVYGAIAKEAETRASAISTAKSSLIGTTNDTSSVDTIKGAKAYATSLNSAMDARVDTIEDKLNNVSNVMDFIGVASAAPTSTKVTLTDGTIITSFQSGDVVVYGNDEYVWTGSKWELFGNTDANTTAISNLTERIAAAESDIDTNTSNITTNANNIADLDSQLSILSFTVSNNETDIEDKVTAINNKIGTAASGQTGTIYSLIAANATAISTETTNRTNSDTALGNRITTLENLLTWGTF